jgi:Zn-dependent metalloprotease
MGKKHKQKSNPHQKNMFSYFHHSTSENATTHIILTPTTDGLPISHTHPPQNSNKKKTTKECTTENRHPTKEKKNTTTHTNLIMPSRRKENQNPMP